mmetsp:Transcript_16300/g.45403  ORF Transcript_16300/g.45403 Transcript_16300/m.45403 type:complete len:237 (+) Transcript_16300:537-1247(+)
MAAYLCHIWPVTSAAPWTHARLAEYPDHWLADVRLWWVRLCSFSVGGLTFSRTEYFGLFAPAVVQRKVAGILASPLPSASAGPKHVADAPHIPSPNLPALPCPPPLSIPHATPSSGLSPARSCCFVALAYVILAAAFRERGYAVLLFLGLHPCTDASKRYRVPHGGLFALVSCPNYFGEMVQWTGFAVACWSTPGAAFAIATAANLLPRGLSHHHWYLCNLKGYPSGRRGVIPYLL